MIESCCVQKPKGFQRNPEGDIQNQRQRELILKKIYADGFLRLHFLVGDIMEKYVEVERSIIKNSCVEYFNRYIKHFCIVDNSLSVFR